MHTPTDYEKYILVSEHSRFAVGTYPAFIRLKELMSTLNSMENKATLILIMEKYMLVD